MAQQLRIARYAKCSATIHSVDSFLMSIDVIRTDTGFEVEIPVPGFKTEQIELIVKENVLTLTAKSDRRAFTRSLKFPDDVDAQNIEASVDNGLLTLALKRHPDAQPRRIEIKGRG
jgi:HSP20 family protein